MKSAVLALLVLVACKHHEDKPAPAPRPSPAKPAAAARPPVAAPIDATTGAPELLPEDGVPMNPLPIAEFRAKLSGSTSVVIATQFPAGLSATAGAGVNLIAGDKNVSWVFDGTWLAYDENANGDLRDDPRHPFTRGELLLTLHIAGPVKGSTLDAPARIRLVGGKPFLQGATVRRGTLALPGGPMPFALLGDMGRYGEDYQIIAFDMDRDGAMDLKTLDAPGQIRIFEQTVSLDGKGYAFQVDPAGDSLTLVGVAKDLPPRPTLAVGSPAPDVAFTTLDGKATKLSGLRGQVVLIDFWATMCHPCVQSLPRLAALRAKHHDHGFELVAIAMPTPDVQQVLGDHAAGLETADEAAQTAYRIDRFPTYFLLDRTGTIACSRCQLDAIEPMIEKLTAISR